MLGLNRPNKTAFASDDQQRTYPASNASHPCKPMNIKSQNSSPP